MCLKTKKKDLERSDGEHSPQSERDHAGHANIKRRSRVRRGEVRRVQDNHRAVEQPQRGALRLVRRLFAQERREVHAVALETRQTPTAAAERRGQQAQDLRDHAGVGHSLARTKGQHSDQVHADRGGLPSFFFAFSFRTQYHNLKFNSK